MASMSRMNRRRYVVGCVALGLAVWLGPALSSLVGAQSPPPALTYTAAQAERGRSTYIERCASCHGQNMDDGAFGPPLVGVDFRQKWGWRSTDALFALASTTMPPDRPGTLGDQRYAELLALILQENGLEKGTRDLPADPDQLRAMSTPGWPRISGGGLAPGA